MIGEVAVCLARDLPKSALPGGVWTPGAAIAAKIIPRLIERAGMKFDLLTEAGERRPIASDLFRGEEPNLDENPVKEWAIQ